jgi:hypothetical protein
MKVGDYLRDLGVDMRIILKWTLHMSNVRMQTGLNSALHPYAYTLGSRSADTVRISRRDPTGNCGYIKPFSTKVYKIRKRDPISYLRFASGC